MELGFGSEIVGGTVIEGTDVGDTVIGAASEGTVVVAAVVLVAVQEAPAEGVCSGTRGPVSSRMWYWDLSAAVKAVWCNYAVLGSALPMYGYKYGVLKSSIVGKSYTWSGSACLVSGVSLVFLGSSNHA